MIAIGISNISAKLYWLLVYTSFDLTMASKTTSFFQFQDTSRFYKQEYKERTDMKIKRVKDQN